MVTEFQERLRQIREAKDRELQEKHALESAANVDRFSKMELRFVHREKVEQVIGEHSDRFMDEVPSFSRTKSFFEGKYKIEVACEDLLIDMQGRVDKYFSRITFLLDPKPDVGAALLEAGELVRVRCKKTVRNRDLESTVTDVGSSPEALDAFRQFSEDQFYEFAGAYFSNSQKAPAN